VGSHSHCLQINDIVTACDGRTVPVIYSMGNFVTN
jgi:poly-gamma-glutamate capsule biosynthesis protein CapA/YwtB (metallophosphatase superfamily)